MTHLKIRTYTALDHLSMDWAAHFGEDSVLFHQITIKIFFFLQTHTWNNLIRGPVQMRLLLSDDARMHQRDK